MIKLLHKISNSEIKYGILTLKKYENTLPVFLNLPNTFTVNIKGTKLYERMISSKNRIWLGVEVTRKFHLGENIKISREKNTIYIE